MIRIGAEDGVALATAVMTVLLLSAVAAALLLVSSSEVSIAAYFRSSVAAQYAVEAVMVRAIGVIGGVDDWSEPIAGASRSALVDGPPVGTRSVPGGSSLDFVAAVNLANCQKTTACSASDFAAVTADRPWGANNPVWQPYAYGPLNSLLDTSTGVTSPHYVLLLVADDPTGTHRAGAAAGREAIAMRAEAYGPHGAHAVLEAVVDRSVVPPTGETHYNPGAEPPMKILSWREVR
jgi:hypothetical protein